MQQSTFLFSPKDPEVLALAQRAADGPGDMNDQAMRAMGAAVILMTGCGYSADDQAKIVRIFREALVEMIGEPEASSVLNDHAIVNSKDL